MAWLASPVVASSLTADPLVLKFLLLVLLTPVIIMLNAPILLTTWDTSVNASQGGKVSTMS